jgi:hypothetical protein
MNKKTIDIIEYDSEKKYQGKPSACLVIEEDADEEEEGVAQQYLILHKAKRREDKQQEYPEIRLSKQQRRVRVKRKSIS